MFAPNLMQSLNVEKLRGSWNEMLLQHRQRRHPEPVLAETDAFLIKLAENAGEVLAAQQLRYRVFKLEQGRMHSCREEIDLDRFDSFCRHLIVVEKSSGRVVGTYRVLSGRAAAKAGNFYSEEEFAIRGLDGIGRELCEVGRSCVDPDYRGGAVVGLLWSGLVALRRRPEGRSRLLNNLRRRRRPAAAAPNFQYLFGCVSLEDPDPVHALALYEYFRRKNLLSDRLAARPRPGFELGEAKYEEIQRYCDENEAHFERLLPPLFKGYVKLGARICGEPAFDREFGTIDFLILLDMRQMPARYARHYAI